MVEAKLKVMGVALRMAGGYFYVDRGGNGNGNVVDVRRLPCFGMSGLDARCFDDDSGGGPSRMAGHAMMMSYVSGGVIQQDK